MTRLYEGAHSTISFQESSDYNTPVAIKQLKSEVPTARQITHFANEYNLCKDLREPGIRSVYEYSRINGKHALVMKYVDGTPLKHAFEEQRPTLEEMLAISIRIADILERIHHHHIIHKDLNGNNILVNRDTGDVAIIDFGIASRIERKA